MTCCAYCPGPVSPLSPRICDVHLAEAALRRELAERPGQELLQGAFEVVATVARGLEGATEPELAVAPQPGLFPEQQKPADLTFCPSCGGLGDVVDCGDCFGKGYVRVSEHA